MPTKCEKCGKTVNPKLELKGDIDFYICPKCGACLCANTGGIHVRGRDM